MHSHYNMPSWKVDTQEEEAGKEGCAGIRASKRESGVEGEGGRKEKWGVKANERWKVS